MDSMTQWIARLVIGGSLSLVSYSQSKASVVSLIKKFYPHCLVQVGSRNRFNGDLHKQKLLVSKSD